MHENVGNIDIHTAGAGGGSSYFFAVLLLYL